MKMWRMSKWWGTMWSVGQAVSNRSRTKRGCSRKVGRNAISSVRLAVLKNRRRLPDWRSPLMGFLDSPVALMMR